MWVAVAMVVAAAVAAVPDYQYADYYYQSVDEDAVGDLYEAYDEEHTESTMMYTAAAYYNRSFARIRRFGQESAITEDPRYIKGVLKEILGEDDLDSMSDDADDIIEWDRHRHRPKHTIPGIRPTRTPKHRLNSGHPLRWHRKQASPPVLRSDSKDEMNRTEPPPRTLPENFTYPTTPEGYVPRPSNESTMDYDAEYVAPNTTTESDEPEETTPSIPSEETPTDWAFPTYKEAVSSRKPKYTGPTKPRPHFGFNEKADLDINAILGILANLTYDYEWNITEEFNRTLIESGAPKCPTPPEPTTMSTIIPSFNMTNASVISKCFVCGLTTTEIPRTAHCSDAFGGDFLPMAPVDARARGHIASFRKYCRYLDVRNFLEDPAEPRSIYGRFTGGCGVRWTDLSSVYTQRTCRARHRPLLGKHFGSKRLAKLELALINVENGCIASPMATLLPLSRGVSLYARFHACVCTGNWCNRAPPTAAPARQRAMHAFHALLAHFLIHRSVT